MQQRVAVIVMRGLLTTPKQRDAVVSALGAAGLQDAEVDLGLGAVIGTTSDPGPLDDIIGVLGVRPHNG